MAWQEFVEHYEQFTDLLCVAAKEGVSSRREARYASLRCWLLQNYPHVAPRLRPYLAGCRENGNTELTLVDPVSSHRRRLDCFESVLLPNTLEDLFREDSGGLIDLVSRVSDAVYKCDELLTASTAS